MKLKSLLKKKTILSAKDINNRDPFVLYENGTYYMYCTRAKVALMFTPQLTLKAGVCLTNASTQKGISSTIW